jgi:cytochrome c biogenesis protein CcmG/thiol:disulfide interchange protein DsbE
MKVKIIISFLIPIVVLSLFFLGLQNSNQYSTRDLVGTKIGEFELKELNGKKNISKNTLNGNKYTLINFFASWCAPCRNEHPLLLYLDNIDELKILGINFKDNESNAVKYLNELQNPYDYVALDKKGKASIIFGIYGIPESILIDQDLNILKKFVGPINEYDLKTIEEIIKK